MKKKQEKTERLIDLLKIMQTFEGTKDRLMEKLGIEDKKTLEDDIKILEKGWNFLGWNIKIGKRVSRKQRYGISGDLSDSTFHPIFFCLNLTELIMLVDSLKNSHNEIVSEDLMEFIFRQLSDKAIDKIILKYPDLEKFKKTKVKLRTRQESEIYTEDDFEYYFVKPGGKIKIEMKDGSFISGTPKFSKMNSDKHLIQSTDGGVKEIDLSQIVDITRL